MLEERKLFVAGLPQQTREGDLRGHFARYGEVVHTRVVLDMASGNSRGFGFVEFADEAATLRALAEEEMPKHVFRGRKVKRPSHSRRLLPAVETLSDRYDACWFLLISSNLVDVKRAECRHAHKQTSPSLKNQNNGVEKLFVGGLHENVTEKDFISYFEKFGTITDVVVMRNKITNRPRGFGFISFDSNEAVCKILQDRFHNLNGTDVEVKVAVPKSYVYDYEGPIGYLDYAYGGPIEHEHDRVSSYHYAKNYSKTSPINIDTTKK
uniref:RRM domain-containing protein n=1 Tax=Oryza punctata TaxID=4537 RepID=A0A0E0KJI8_ORYPU